MKKVKLGNVIVLRDCSTCMEKITCDWAGCEKQICSISETDMGCEIGAHYRSPLGFLICDECYRKGYIPAMPEFEDDVEENDQD